MMWSIGGLYFIGLIFTFLVVAMCQDYPKIWDISFRAGITVVILWFIVVPIWAIVQITRGVVELVEKW